jgi:hypothetical protein
MMETLECVLASALQGLLGGEQQSVGRQETYACSSTWRCASHRVGDAAAVAYVVLTNVLLRAGSVPVSLES